MIREYAENDEAEIIEYKDRLVIKAYNEAVFNCTLVDLIDVISWVRQNKPELLK